MYTTPKTGVPSWSDSDRYIIIIVITACVLVFGKRIRIRDDSGKKHSFSKYAFYYNIYSALRLQNGTPVCVSILRRRPLWRFLCSAIVAIQPSIPTTTAIIIITITTRLGDFAWVFPLNRRNAESPADVIGIIVSAFVSDCRFEYIYIYIIYQRVVRV